MLPWDIRQVRPSSDESLFDSLVETHHYRLLGKLVDSHLCLTGLIEDRQMTIEPLRKILFGSSTEKTRTVVKKTGEEDESESPQASDGDARAPPEQTEEENAESRPKCKGHEESLN